MATATLAAKRRETLPAAVAPGPEYRSYEDGEYVVYEDVPVWCEHYSRLVDQKFGRDELEQVAARCNERIEETGDYSPIVLRHTKDGGENDPPVVGLAGPFSIGTIGKSKPKTAILARMRFFKSDIDRVKRYPRVSVEYWFKKSDPTSGYFDPISLLGAETPELDLGLRYSKHRENGEKCIRYSQTNLSRADYAATAAPGGANTFIPGAGGAGDSDADDKKRRNRNAMDSVEYDRDGQCQDGVGLSAAAIAQVVQALRPVVKELVMEVMPAPQAPAPDESESEAFSADAGAGAGLPPDGSAPAGNDPDGDGDADADTDADGDGDDADADDAADNSSNNPGGQDGTSGMDAAAGAGSKSKPPKPKKSEAEDMADSNDKSKGKAKYSAELSGELAKIVSETPAADAKIVARYEKLAKQSLELVESLGTERDEYRAKYEKATRDASDKGAELTEIKARVDAIESEARHNARYAKLQDLVHQDGYSIDIEEELKDCASFDELQFNRHLEKIKANYQRVPMRGLPLAAPQFNGKRPESEASDEQRERFAKEAGEMVFKARERGDASVTYGSALADVYQKAGKALPAAV